MSACLSVRQEVEMGCLRLTYWNKVEMQSYRDDLKTTSKTERTPIFEIGGKQVSDYYLFGMLSDTCFSSSEKLSRTNVYGGLDSEWDKSGEMPVSSSSKYPEPKALTNHADKVSRNASKIIQKGTLVYTVTDKTIKTYNAAVEDEYSIARHHAVTGIGATVATVMMATPTGFSQVAGALLMAGIIIYDLVAEPEPKPK